MDSNIFRKKSIDKVSSPEQLNDYIRVSNPAVWSILVAIVILLCGVCVWGIFGHLDTTVKSAGICENGIITCYVKEADIGKISRSMKITVNGEQTAIVSIAESPIKVDGKIDSYAQHIGGLQSGEWVYPVTAACGQKNGTFQTEIVVESISPMSFVFN